MIIGIGHDLCDIRRIEQTLAKYGERFLTRCFTEGEIAKAKSRSSLAPTLAKRFAAKEAMAKALGTGFRAGVFWRDLEVINLPTGQPSMKLYGGAAARLAQLLPPAKKGRILLTLTDEYPLAVAHVVIEAGEL